MLTREYYQDYACEFNLLYYPFDTQMCVMYFEIKGKTDDYIQLQKDGYGVEFLCELFCIYRLPILIIDHINSTFAIFHVIILSEM